MFVLEIDAIGQGTCLHTDELPLNEFGKLNMERASAIEWSDEFQQWEVFINGTFSFADCSRAKCLEWERVHFNAMILDR